MNAKQKQLVATAHLLHSKLVVVSAPDYVTDAMRQWIRQLESGDDSINKEEVSISEVASMELTDAKARN